LDCGVEGFRIFSGHYEATRVEWRCASNYVGYLGPGIGGGNYGASTGEHACEFGGHDEVGRAGTLRKKMDVGGVEQFVEALDGLQRQ
jgi:hypothetical protein